VLTALRRSALREWVASRLTAPTGAWLDRRINRLLPEERTALGAAQPREGARRRVGVALRAVLILALLALGLWGALGTLQMLAQVGPQDWLAIGAGTGATFLRTVAALAIGTAWTLPVGVALGLNPRLARRVQPLVQVVASIPATGLFPALLLVFLSLPGGLDVAAIALMLLGTQWYVLFNVIAGAQAVPTDLREAAQIFRVRGWRRWRYLILPGIFSSLVTGLITATGGAWNASIVSEYVTFGGQKYSTVGLGSLIAGAADAANYPLLLAGTLTMAAVVVAVNTLVWHRLYGLAQQRYRLE